MIEFIGMVKIKKPNNTLFEYGRGKPDLQKGSNIGRQYFLRLLNHFSSSENKKHHHIFFTGKSEIFPEDNPYDFEHIVVSRSRLLFDNKNYFVGFDNRGRIYFFDDKRQKNGSDISIQDIFYELTAKVKRQKVVSDFFAALKNSKVMTIDDNVESEVTFLKSLLENYLEAEDGFFNY